MAGYTPVFDSVFKGSLYGKWPDTAAWICMLALADSRGHIDFMPEAISGMTGMPLADLLGCIERFCAPDPRSRSQAEEGRKLVLLDPARDWGWRVVNIQLYRERARDQNRVNDGRNAEKLRNWREAKRNPVKPGETRRHPELPDDPNSDSDSDSDSDKNKRGEGTASRKRSATATRLPADFELTEQRRAIAKTEGVDPDREFAKFTDYWRASSGAGARKHDWDATWRNWCRKAQDMKPRSNGASRKTHTPAPTVAELEAREVTRLAGEGKSIEFIAQEIGVTLERARELMPKEAHAGH